MSDAIENIDLIIDIELELLRDVNYRIDETFSKLESLSLASHKKEIMLYLLGGLKQRYQILESKKKRCCGKNQIGRITDL